MSEEVAQVPQWSINRLAAVFDSGSDVFLIAVWAISKAILKHRGHHLSRGRWVLNPESK